MATGVAVRGRCWVMRLQDDWTAVMLAAFNGHESTVGLLLDRGADVEARNKVSGGVDPCPRRQRGVAASAVGWVCSCGWQWPGAGGCRPAALLGRCSLRAVCEAACPHRVWGVGRGGVVAAARGVVGSGGVSARGGGGGGWRAGAGHVARRAWHGVRCVMLAVWWGRGSQPWPMAVHGVLLRGRWPAAVTRLGGVGAGVWCVCWALCAGWPGRWLSVARGCVWVEGVRWRGGRDGDWRGCAWSLLGDATAERLDGGHGGCTERPRVDGEAAAGSRRRRGGTEQGERRC